MDRAQVMASVSDEELAFLLRMRERSKQEFITEFVNNPQVRDAAIDALRLSENGGTLEAHTFRIGDEYLNFLRDLVYYKRTIEKKPQYSQTKALHRAIQLLKVEVGPIPSRPEEVKREELVRNKKIENARKSTMMRNHQQAA